MTVALPGGRVVEGRLQARRRDSDGRWWYEVAIDVPSAAAQPIEGEYYTQVPTRQATEDAGRGLGPPGPSCRQTRTRPLRRPSI